MFSWNSPNHDLSSFFLEHPQSLPHDDGLVLMPLIHLAPTSDSLSCSAALGAFERECLLLFEEIAQSVGVPKSVGQIYGVLYVSRQPLSFSDIVERLKISKGSASQGLQLLRSLGAIKLVNTDGRFVGAPGLGLPIVVSRRDYFEPELSLRKLMGGILRERVAPLAALDRDSMERLRKLAKQVGKENEFYLDRAEQLNTWRKQLVTVLPLLKTLLGPVP